MRPTLACFALIAVLGSGGVAGAAGSTRPANDAVIPVLKHVLKQVRGTPTAKPRWASTVTPTTQYALNSVPVDEDASSHVATDRVHHRSQVSGQSPRLATLGERLFRATGVTPHQFTTTSGKTGAVVMLVEGAAGDVEGTPLAFGPLDLEVTHAGTSPRPVLRLLTVTSEQAVGGLKTTIAVERVEWDPTPVGVTPVRNPVRFSDALGELRQSRPAPQGPPAQPPSGTPTTPGI